MNMTPGLRKFALTLHVTFSIGWFGAVVAFLPLSLVGLISSRVEEVRAVYLAMELITWWAIVPLAFASLVSRLVSSLGTRWGLFQYYWVVLKLVITVLATIVLVIHTQPIDFLARAMTNTTIMSAELQQAQLQMVIASSAAAVVLFLLTALSVYKPRGLTRYGQHKQQATASAG